MSKCLVFWRKMKGEVFWRDTKGYFFFVDYYLLWTSHSLWFKLCKITLIQFVNVKFVVCVCVVGFGKSLLTLINLAKAETKIPGWWDKTKIVSKWLMKSMQRNFFKGIYGSNLKTNLNRWQRGGFSTLLTQWLVSKVDSQQGDPGFKHLSVFHIWMGFL